MGKRAKMVKELITEVVGFSPYERRMMDMLKTGGASAEKRMYKYAKRRVRNFHGFQIAPRYCPLLHCIILYFPKYTFF